MGERIVVEPGSYACQNMGDVAMMQVAVARIEEFWPSTQIEIVTSRPDQLSRFCPSAEPIPVEERDAWLWSRSLLGRFREKLPAGISASARRLERRLWLHRPEVMDLGFELKTAIMRRPFPSASSFRRRLTEADLLVIAGMGGINDAFPRHAIGLLDEIEVALEAGIPVVAFGQGIGPLSNPELLARAREVLPRLTLIGLREAYASLPLLDSFGVPMERIHVTGDDAIEPALELRPRSLGRGIGINLRLAEYAETGADIAGELREPLRLSVQKLDSYLVPVPISLHASDSDVEAIKTLLNGWRPQSQAKIEGPEDVIRLAGDCRVVVTGSYHGGVFALAQGVPVVGLVHSPYYEQKFTGLQKQFPGGCRVIDFRQPGSSGEILDAILSAWESAEELREPLLEAAARQVELGRAAYRAARSLCPLES